MRTRLSRLRIRDLTVFVVVSTVTAIAVLIGTSEVCGCGLQRASSADDEQPAAEPLTLMLSTPAVCESEPAQGYSGSALRQDEEGNWTKRVDVFLGWFGVGEVDVGWSFAGGTAPYTLTIDGESRDGAGSYESQTGTASVSCAQSFDETFINNFGERGYRGEPRVDSGIKTIQATVTDAVGQTAIASVEVYVVLSQGSSGDRLEGGKTYRVFGELLTIPTGIDLMISGIESGFGGGEAYILEVVGQPARILLNWGTNREVVRVLPPSGASDDALDIGAKFDELVASAGREPVLTGGTP